MASQTGSQIIVICILTNMSRSKGNQAMKFGLFIEYNTKSYTRCGEESIPIPFSKKKFKIEHISESITANTQR